MSLEPVSVVIPTFDSGPYLTPLYNSIIKSPLLNVASEIIFVCEGQGDNTDEILKKLAQDSPIPLKIVRPYQRLGKFLSRLEGVKMADNNRVLLVDSRVQLTEKTASAIAHLPKELKIISGHIEIDEGKNIFCLYWTRTHTRIFHRNYSKRDEMIVINPENFDQFVTGTTILIADRALYITTCEDLSGSPMFSDDTFLLKEMCAKSPLIIHPEIRIEWEPRKEWWKFLKHLYDRGPGFAEYHIFEKRGWLFYLVLAGFLGLLTVITLFLIKPTIAFGLLGVGIISLALSTFLFSHSIKEFFVLAPLHTLSLMAYGLGAINGARVIWLSRRRSYQEAESR